MSLISLLKPKTYYYVTEDNGEMQLKERQLNVIQQLARKYFGIYSATHYQNANRMITKYLHQVYIQVCTNLSCSEQPEEVLKANTFLNTERGRREEILMKISLRKKYQLLQQTERIDEIALSPGSQFEIYPSIEKELIAAYLYNSDEGILEKNKSFFEGLKEEGNEKLEDRIGFILKHLSATINRSDAESLTNHIGDIKRQLNIFEKQFPALYQKIRTHMYDLAGLGEQLYFVSPPITVVYQKTSHNTGKTDANRRHITFNEDSTVSNRSKYNQPPTKHAADRDATKSLGGGDKLKGAYQHTNQKHKPNPTALPPMGILKKPF